MVHTKKLSNSKLIAVNKIVELINSNKVDTALLLIKKHIPKGTDLYYFLQGMVAQQQNNIEKAIRFFEKTLSINALYIDALVSLSSCYFEAGDIQKAEECAEQSYLIDNNNSLVLLNLGTILASYNTNNTAIQTRAANILFEAFNIEIEKITPNIELLAEILTTWSKVKINTGEYEQAKYLLDKAYVLSPYNTQTNSTLANCLIHLGEIEKALTHLKIAQLGMTDLTDSLYQEGMLNILLGNFSKGWRLHEYRVKSNKFKERNLIRGEYLTDLNLLNPHTKLLVFQEQGIGDLLQFSRYLAYLPCEVTLAVKPNTFYNKPENSISKVLKDTYGYNLQDVITIGFDPIPNDFEYSVSIMSLPYLFGKVVPNEELKPLEAYELASTHVVGLFWRGSQHHTNNKNRSIPTSYINNFVKNNKDITFINLQLDNIPDLEAHDNLLNVSNYMQSFEDTVKVVRSCTIVITVDSMIAHLAASCGIPTWILHSKSPDWRWGLNSEKSDWYPSVVNFRQTKLGEWEYVLEQVTTELNSQKNILLSAIN